ncbi:sulfate ABC transporter permease subunit CysW [Zymobacter palmae]|uniref:ABC-type sulfate transport system, permease n=1 Tax=Zymobacter palmae TaxID=33074 RepID=A0A348HCS2_9GAMM|nr:sulfate ABC transporter permease subunit CysW [Zymobacter palmae]BBG29424.1 ABC-type sulfate transport system, permease [Zymobacter palmae]
MIRIGYQRTVRRVLIGAASLVALWLLLVPLIAIVAQAFAQGVQPFWASITDLYTVKALLLTLLVAVITVPINLVFGVTLAWLITRFSFPGRRLLQTLIDIPFAVSPVIAGLLYLLLYGTNGWLGGWLADHDIQLMFAWPGIVLVTLFVTCPFVAREVIPVMQVQGRLEEEAAVTLGANGWTLFFRITLPNIRLALLYGVVLTNARAIGEFGAVSIVSGAIRGDTSTLPLQVQQLYQDYNIVGAFASALILALLAVLTLLIKALLDRYAQQHTEGE